MTLCPYCQAQNADSAAYCVRCGQPVGAAPPAPPGAMAAPGAGQKKGLALTSLILGILSIPSLGCLGVGALAAIVFGIVALVKGNKEPHIYGGKGMAIAGMVTGGISLLLLPFAIGIIAAISIPSLLRARVSANESATIGDVRTVISAQAAYASSNGGFYDSLECLGTPAGCIPSYSGPTFLDPMLASGGPKNGYKRTLHLGAPADLGMATQPVSPSSVAAYAYVAVPINQGQTGVRSFCGDAAGVVCYTRDGSEPRVVDGACVIDEDCTALR